ncbi:MAG: protein translocase SEC61 complex subunit gamma [Candidatus Pacearchaeota archaeon]
MSLFISLQDFLLKCKRVWVVTKKPTNLEFKTIAKASAIGILAIGLVGFLVSTAIRFLS